MYRTLLTIGRNLGLIPVVGFWIIATISIRYNPWFNIWKHAFSDLGTKDAVNPWIYNYGLRVLGAITMLYSIYLAYASWNKFMVFSSALIFVAGIFLSLIGIYPGGTRPHTFVSTWFFIQFFIALIPMAIGFVFSGKYIDALFQIIIFIVALLGAILVKWPSAALIEAYEILLIDIVVIHLWIRL